MLEMLLQQDNDAQAADATPDVPKEVKAVIDAFTTRLGWSLKDVTVSLENGEIVLGGRTKSFYLKQMAQETVRSVLGREIRIRNGIVVDR